MDARTAHARTPALIEDLRTAGNELSWVEFKKNNCDPQMIGTRISTLSNAAGLEDKQAAYIMWSIRNADHAVVGTTFNPDATVVQKEPLNFDSPSGFSQASSFHSNPLCTTWVRLSSLR